MSPDRSTEESAGSASGARLAELIAQAGVAVGDFYRAGRRTALTSPLFNVKGRLLVGSECYFRHLPWLIRAVSERSGPQELGAAGRGVCRRPNAGGVHGLAHSYLNGREQRRLAAGLPAGVPLPEEDPADLGMVMGFWDRAATAYFGEPAHLPADGAGEIRILDTPTLAELDSATRSGLGEARHAAIRRAMAVAELYTFIANGESRVGVFHHGPYPVDDGEVLLIKELVGMRDRMISWQNAPMPEIDVVARVVRLRDVRVSMDLFGSLITDPSDYEERILGEEVITVVDGAVEVVDPEALAALEAATAEAQLRMYEEAAGWDETRQVTYGGDLYAFLAKPWLVNAGCEGLVDEMVDRFRATAAEVAGRIVSGAERLLLHDRLAGGEREVYESESVLRF